MMSYVIIKRDSLPEKYLLPGGGWTDNPCEAVDYGDFQQLTQVVQTINLQEQIEVMGAVRPLPHIKK